MSTVDCHQHLWPSDLVARLGERDRAPRLRGWRLELDGEPDFDVDPAAHDLTVRAELDRADGIDLTLLSLSSPLGLELLPAHEAEPLLAGWHALADQVGPSHRLWAAVALGDRDGAEQAGLGATLAHPAVCGLQVPATAMADPAALARLAPVLAVVEAADLPVLVHPGPAPAAGAQELPGWWPALTSYAAQQAAAWWSWHVAGRSLLPRLRICFVALAGLAPLHHERLAQRGGTLGEGDPGVFFETSSYGPQAIGAMARVVGVDALVHGSDRPYAAPVDTGLGPAGVRALRETNPRRLLGR